MSGAPTPSDPAAAALKQFLELRASLRTSPVGGGGGEVCRALTSSLDRAIEELAGGFGPGLAVVALGGYGRCELSLFSDVDLMLLHDKADPSEAAAALFRPLWDAGLRVGHSVRTAREAARAARERFDTFTTLLTRRLVTGDGTLFDELTADITAVTRARPLRRYLVNEERRRRGDEPYLLMAADVKSGRGSLRTLHAFEWERRREELIGRFSTEAGPEEDIARETLLAVRNGLHATTGRPHDTFSFDLREPVARWLDSQVEEVAERLVNARQTVDHLTSRRWPELTDGPSRFGRVLIRRERVDGSAAPDSLSFPEFATILRAGGHGQLAVERLRESGHLIRVLPEWETVRMAPQLAPFHEHPLEAHLWRTVAEMQALIDGDDDHYSAIAREVDSPDALTMAAFLHDIGKGRRGNHATVGAGIARAACERLGCPADVSALVEGAVRHHLLLSETATRSDLEDPGVIGHVAEEVGDLRLLQVLYLLSVADSKATGSTMWNEWKATLVRTLFMRCAALFGADRPVTTGTTREQVIVQAPAGLRPGVKVHLDRMPENYLRSSTASEVLWHLELIENMRAGWNLGVRPAETAETAVLVGRGCRQLRRRVAESFAANGIDVLQARMMSRTDALIVDTFLVQDDRTGASVPPDRWERARADIEAAISGGLDTGAKVAARADAYAPTAMGGINPNVRVSVEPLADDGIITLRCGDRIGRLAEVLSIFHEHDIDIRLAKLDSRGGEVVDTFHVPRGRLPADPGGLERLARRIQESITP